MDATDRKKNLNQGKLMFTIFSGPRHELPLIINAPTLKNDLGGGADERHRRWTRPLRRWELDMIGYEDRLDPIIGLLDYAQGDTPIWFDGAGAGDIVEPILLGIGNGNITDFRLPHRHVFVSSLIVYQNNAIVSSWTPIGSTEIADSIRFTSAPALNVQITAKYRRKFKVVLETEAALNHNRIMRNRDNPANSLYGLKYFLQEIAT